MDVLQLAKIGRVIVPLEWLAHALGRVIGAGQDVPEPVFRREIVQTGEERMVLWGIEMGDLRLEEGELEVAHLVPVNDLSVQVQLEAVHQPFDVVRGLL